MRRLRLVSWLALVGCDAPFPYDDIDAAVADEGVADAAVADAAEADKGEIDPDEGVVDPDEGVVDPDEGVVDPDADRGDGTVADMAADGEKPDGPQPDAAPPDDGTPDLADVGEPPDLGVDAGCEARPLVSRGPPRAVPNAADGHSPSVAHAYTEDLFVVVFARDDALHAARFDGNGSPVDMAVELGGARSGTLAWHPGGAFAVAFEGLDGRSARLRSLDEDLEPYGEARPLYAFDAPASRPVVVATTHGFAAATGPAGDSDTPVRLFLTGGDGALARTLELDAAGEGVVLAAAPDHVAAGWLRVRPDEADALVFRRASLLGVLEAEAVVFQGEPAPSRPRLVRTGDGFRLFWIAGAGLWSMGLDPTGQVDDPAAAIELEAAVREYDVAWTGGGFVAVWTNDAGVHAVRLDPDAAPGEVLLVAPEPAPVEAPAVAWSGRALMATWARTGGDEPGVRYAILDFGDCEEDCVGAGEEVVDGVDDDCDTFIDEGAGFPEFCDEADDDEDGRIDEGVTNPCGRCGLLPPEICNEDDDDCDGDIDEGYDVGGACFFEAGGFCHQEGENVCAVGATLCQLPPEPACGALLGDGFDGPLEDGWIPTRGAWAVEAGRACSPNEVDPGIAKVVGHLATFDVSVRARLGGELVHPALAVNATGSDIGRPYLAGAGMALFFNQTLDAPGRRLSLHVDGAEVAGVDLDDGEGEQYVLRIRYDGARLAGWVWAVDDDPPAAPMVEAAVEPGAVDGDRVGFGANVSGGARVVCFDDLAFECPAEACNEVDDDCDDEVDEGQGIQCDLGADACLSRSVTACTEGGALRCDDGSNPPAVVTYGLDDDVVWVAGPGAAAFSIADYAPPFTVLARVSPAGDGFTLGFGDGLSARARPDGIELSNGGVDDPWIERSGADLDAHERVVLRVDVGGDGAGVQAFDDAGDPLTGGASRRVDVPRTRLVANGEADWIALLPGAAAVRAVGGERCDDIDNDCDGQTDEGFDGIGEACRVGLGQCTNDGILECQEGGYLRCSVTPGPASAEWCGDQVDNDCDGATDEVRLPAPAARVRDEPVVGPVGRQTALGHPVATRRDDGFHVFFGSENSDAALELGVAFSADTVEWGVDKTIRFAGRESPLVPRSVVLTAGAFELFVLTNDGADGPLDRIMRARSDDGVEWGVADVVDSPAGPLEFSAVGVGGVWHAWARAQNDGPFRHQTSADGFEFELAGGELDLPTSFHVLGHAGGLFYARYRTPDLSALRWMVSEDGERWIDAGPMLEAGGAAAWDRHLVAASVVREGDRALLFYAGDDSMRGGRSIGLAAIACGQLCLPGVEPVEVGDLGWEYPRMAWAPGRDRLAVMAGRGDTALNVFDGHGRRVAGPVDEGWGANPQGGDVAWTGQEFAVAAVADEADGEILLRRFDLQGAARGQRVVTDRRVSSRAPVVAASPNSLAITWYDHGVNSYHLVVTDLTGVPLGAVRNLPVGDGRYADLAWSGSEFAHTMVDVGRGRIIVTRYDGVTGVQVGRQESHAQGSRPNIAWNGERWGLLYRGLDGSIQLTLLQRDAQRRFGDDPQIEVAPSGEHPVLTWTGTEWAALFVHQGEAGVVTVSADESVSQPAFVTDWSDPVLGGDLGWDGSRFAVVTTTGRLWVGLPHGECPAECEAADEVCNGVDDDCDGASDEGCALPGHDFVRFEADAYHMGSDAGAASERSPHLVRFPAFEITRAEVTNAQYRSCVAAGGCTPRSWEGTCAPVEQEYAEAPHLPAVCLTFAQAEAYAAWAGARLPSEVEWEYVARSRGRGMLFPWGDEPSCERAVVLAGPDGDCGIDGPEPVCSRDLGHTDQGVCDLTGNAAEWVQDCWHGSYDIEGRPDDGSPWVEAGCDLRVVRGASFASRDAITGERTGRTTARAMGATAADPHIGFRLAR